MGNCVSESYEPATSCGFHQPTLLPALFKDSGFVMLHYTPFPEAKQSFDEFTAGLPDSCIISAAQLACLDKHQLIARSVLEIRAVRLGEHVTEFGLLVEVTNGHLVLEYGPVSYIKDTLKSSKQRLVAQFKPPVRQLTLNMVSLIRSLHSSFIEAPHSVDSPKRLMRLVKACAS